MKKERFLTVLVPISDSDCETTVYASLSALNTAVPASAANINKIYKVSDGTYYRSTKGSGTSYSYQAVTDREFPYLGDPMDIYDFTYDATRMGNAPNISAQGVMRYAQKGTYGEDITLEGLWRESCHVVFNGEKLFLKNIPTSSKSNEDARYRYDLQFVSENVVLENVYIYDVVQPYISERPVSENSTFSFFGDISELAKRINASLIRSKLASLVRKYVGYPNTPSTDVPYLTFEQWNLMNTNPFSLIGVVFSNQAEMLEFRNDIYLSLNGDYDIYLEQYVYENSDGVYQLQGFQCVIGKDKTGAIATSEEKLVSFDKNTVHEALQQIHDTFELQYYIAKEKDLYGNFTGNTLITIADCQHDFADIDPVTGDYVRDEDGVPVSTSPFDYGAENEFLSKEKSNTTEKIVTRITGFGSSDNIPWYYPNPTPDGWIKPVYKREGNEMPSIHVDYPSDEGETVSDNVRWQRYLKNRIGKTIQRGKVIGFSTSTGFDVSEEEEHPSQIVTDAYFLFRYSYRIITEGVTTPMLTVKMDYNAADSGCSKFVATLYRDGEIAAAGNAIYDSAETYENPNTFQTMFINRDGGDSQGLISGKTYFLEIEFKIPSLYLPYTEKSNYEGYHYPHQWVEIESTGVPAYIPENFYADSGLVPYVKYVIGESIIIQETGYSVNGAQSGKREPIVRVKGSLYKDLSNGTIYKCNTSSKPSVNQTEPSPFEEGPKMDSAEWAKKFITLYVKTHELDGWYINGKRIELSDYGLGNPTQTGGGTYSPDVFDTIEFQRLKYVTAQQKLLPEVYIKTDGERRYYEAHNYWDKENSSLYAGTADEAIGEQQTGAYVRNPIYKENETDSDDKHYEFESEYDASHPHEHIEEIEDAKPTIKEQRNYVAVKVSDETIADWANQYMNYFVFDDGEFVNATSTYDPTETYYMLLRIDVVEEFAYDNLDNDDIWESDGDGGTEGEYKHPYFFAKLRPMGFNLFDMALQEDMVVSMTTGSCGACKFKIGVDESTRKNPVQLWEYDVYDGNDLSTSSKVYEANTLRRYVNLTGLYYYIEDHFESVLSKIGVSGGGEELPNMPSMFSSYTYSEEDEKNGFVGVTRKSGATHFEGDVVTSGRFIDSQQDTSENYVWVALMKETDTYGVIMPSAKPNYDNVSLDVYIRPKSVEDVKTSGSTYEDDEENADKFVLVNIAMPYVYIRRAERELSKSLVKQMYESNYQKFNFSIKFSSIFLAENQSVDDDVNENSVMYVLFDNATYRQYVKHYTYTMRHDSALPDISVDMNEELSVSKTLSERRRRESLDNGMFIKSYVDSAIGGLEQKTINSVSSGISISMGSQTTTFIEAAVDPNDQGGLVQGEDGISLMMSSPSSNGSMSSAQYEKLEDLHNTDVAVNGTSVVDSDNVANIVTESAYNASTNKIATMADVGDTNVQSDWAQTDDTADDYIKNKPAIGNAKVYYGTCNTTSLTAAKSVTVANNDFEAVVGVVLIVAFTYGNEEDNPTISVNGGVAVAVSKYDSLGETFDNKWGVGDIVEMVFDGTSWVVVDTDRMGVNGSTLLMSTRRRPSYLKFTALVDNSSIRLAAVGSPAALTLEYALNGGKFAAYTIGDTINLDNGEFVEMRHTEDAVITRLGGAGSSYNEDYYKFSIAGKISASGNVMSLLDAKCLSKTVASSGFVNLFRNCNKLVSAPEVPATNLGNNCYWQMFSSSGIEEAPYLPATTLGSNSYRNIFYGCSGLKTSHVATLNSTTDYMFSGNTSAESLTIDATTPPTITSTTLSGLKSGCIIYVPADSVDAYKAKQYWSARAGYIQAIPEKQPEEYVPYISEINIGGVVKPLRDAFIVDKADKVPNAVSGNFAGLDANGNLTDSGKKDSDFATAEQGTKADNAIPMPSGGSTGQVLKKTADGVTWANESGGGGGGGNAKTFYGTCATAAATAVKAVTCSDFTSADLVEGVTVIVKFSATNSAAVANLKLNVNSTGEYAIKKNSSSSSGGEISNLNYASELTANTVIPFIFNGTYWIVAGLDRNTNTTYSAMTDANLKAGTETTGRLVTAKLLKDNFDIDTANRTVKMRNSTFKDTTVRRFHKISVGDTGLIQNCLCAFDKYGDLSMLGIPTIGGYPTFSKFWVGTEIYYYTGVAKNAGDEIDDVVLYTTYDSVDLRNEIVDPQNTFVNSADIARNDNGEYFGRRPIYLRMSITYGEWNSGINAGEQDYPKDYIYPPQELVGGGIYTFYMLLGYHNGETTSTNWYSMELIDYHPIYHYDGTYDIMYDYANYLFQLAAQASRP